MGLFFLGLSMTHTLYLLHVQLSLAYVAEMVFLLPAARGAYRLQLSGLVIAERAFRRDEVPLLAFPHLYGHLLRLPQGVLGLVCHLSLYFVPAQFL